ncbi:MAG: tRNA (guanosine(37)-N1)-methyltransferase TrmD [Proteobacteria bacterium]|nr:tRNA (guanosine(37)-N1)-methyltransferase TrmD [Pseudomonadota bacterium]
MWHVRIISLFPEIFPGSLNLSVLGRAMGSSWDIKSYNLRDFATDKHSTVDDTPYGGGGGMVLKAEVMAEAIDKCFLQDHESRDNPIIYLTPRGELLKQSICHELSQYYNGVNIICGRFEGIDERVLEEYKIRQISIGDYILSSGDFAAYVLVDGCVRLLPGVLGGEQSLGEESFAVGTSYQCLLEYPHYTKPAVWRGHNVPGVLLSGNHQMVNAWRLEQAKLKTQQTRPDLWDQYLQREEK